MWKGAGTGIRIERCLFSHLIPSAGGSARVELSFLHLAEGSEKSIKKYHVLFRGPFFILSRSELEPYWIFVFACGTNRSRVWIVKKEEPRKPNVSEGTRKYTRPPRTETVLIYRDFYCSLKKSLAFLPQTSVPLINRWILKSARFFLDAFWPYGRPVEGAIVVGGSVHTFGVRYWIHVTLITATDPIEIQRKIEREKRSELASKGAVDPILACYLHMKSFGSVCQSVIGLELLIDTEPTGNGIDRGGTGGDTEKHPKIHGNSANGEGFHSSQSLCRLKSTILASVINGRTDNFSQVFGSYYRSA